MCVELLLEEEGKLGGRNLGEPGGKEEEGKEVGNTKQAQGAGVSGIGDEGVGRPGVMDEDGKEQESIDEGLSLETANAERGFETEVAFPGTEEDFDPPAQAVKSGDLFGGYLLGRSVGEEKAPTQEMEIEFVVLKAFISVEACFAAALVSHGRRQGNGDEANGEAFIESQENGEIDWAG